MMMPNHITNIVKAKKEILYSLIMDGEIDFNSIKPMPEILKDFSPHSGIEMRAKSAIGLYSNDDNLLNSLGLSNAIRFAVTEKIEPKDIPDLIRAIQCYQETGYVYWYDWCVDNWDTKWNAYGQDLSNIDKGIIKFETAWCMPLKIAVNLSLNHPNEEIEWVYADEDLGSNCGTVTFLGGSVNKDDSAGRWSEMSDEDRNKWHEFAYQVNYPQGDYQEYLKEIEED